MKRVFIPLMVALAAGICVPAVFTAGRATAGFQKLETLVGHWEGKDEQGNTVETDFRLIVSRTALMETLTATGMDEMVTLYSLDGDAIALLHYCPTNNQPRMRAIPPPGDVKQLVFSFEGAGNLPSLATGHEHKLVIQFHDKGHLTERWTWRENGKETEIVFHFARKNGN